MKATIKFLNDWTQTLDGDLLQGGELMVDDDLSRLPVRRDTFRGAAVWDILALARFQPDGQILAASVTESVSSSPGGMTVDRSPAVASFPVPGDAAQVELWFLNIGTPISVSRPRLGTAASGATTFSPSRRIR